MSNRCTLVIALLLAAAPTAVDGAVAERPAAVSPGHPARLVTVADRCPTFSWAQLPDVLRYELVVYQVARDDEAAPVVLRQTIDGRAGSWTPTRSVVFAC